MKGNWYDLTSIKEKILLLERKALKRCLCVKMNTPDNLLYIELNRADIVASIRDRQYKFFQKINTLDNNSAVVRNIIELCEDLDIVKYYKNLQNDHCKRNLKEKKASSMNAMETYTKRYTELTNLNYCPSLYETYMQEDLRIIITRWRLSCFDLIIETGRYRHVSRENRLCLFCDVLEDEQHAIYNCVAYEEIRSEFRDLLVTNPTVNDILNPGDKDTAVRVGRYLKLIEGRRKSLL